MGKGRPRAVEKGVLGQNLGVSSVAPLNIPSGPVYYPTEDEFRDALEYIYKIRPEAEPYGICRIVPPSSWKPPFALDLDSFSFPTKTQAIHQLQARPASCDSKTFELEYNRFLEDHCGKKAKKRVVFEGEELDLCKLFNAVKRYGGYEKVVDEKKWGEVYRVVGTVMKISECAKHVLCQLYREHLFDYENYYNQLNKVAASNRKRGRPEEIKSEGVIEFSLSKRRRRNKDTEKVKVPMINVKEEHDQICEQCKSGFHEEEMLLCDRCNKGWHTYCLSPPLKHVPPGNWYCLDCLNSDKDSFGFVPGKIFSLEAFRRVADRAKKKWFGSGSASKVQIEKKFWEIVEGSLGEVEVMYGSDLDTSAYGSGFPRKNDQRPESIDARVWDEFCASPWNLNNLPKLKGSVLRAVHQNITGVTVPWLYIGMLFSSFCWHFEDHCFYSINYLHWGEPKFWYSVPGSEATAFEKVMRNCLPDLFDAQPDLLFQLVTMLNPSVLQENRVPVYSIQQEPGNFVITFPRSFHGGFNFGLNCAEAVNFAPADWIPHGQFGAELYQLYRKIAVLSHEELLCVVAKVLVRSGVWIKFDRQCGALQDEKKLVQLLAECLAVFQRGIPFFMYQIGVAPYLKKELLRIYLKEKSWREQLWKNGIVRSSSISPRKCTDYVTSEEDRTCIICQKYLYLSAVACRCRRSAFVCLEHWKHLCECKYSKRRLLYHHTLAELYDLVLTVDKYVSDDTLRSLDVQKRNSCHNSSSSLTRKVKDGLVTFAQLAESWLLHATTVLENAFSMDAYVKVLKEAEQFLWAGSDIDPVRDMTKKLMKAQKWAEGISDCISKVEMWSNHRSSDVQKINLEYVNDFLSLDPILCNEPGYLTLKDYAEEANFMVQEINTVLSTCSNVSEWESLYSKICDLPLYLKESEKLWQKISSAKICIESIRDITENQRPAVDVEDLYELKSKISDLGVQLPETEKLFDLIRQVELCRSWCSETLRGPIKLEIVELLLKEFGSFSVNVPELKDIRKYHADAVSLIFRFNDVLKNCHEREDQHNVVHELNCILRDALSLTIQVDELPLVKAELKKACCREKAQKARCTKMTLDFILQLMTEAAEEKIDGEKLFVGIRGVLDGAMSWEERAKYFLANGALMFDFEDIIRTSEDIFVILPSLDGVVNEVLEAKSWLMLSKPFLDSCFSPVNTSNSLLEFEKLKELISRSKLLKVNLEEKRLLETILRNCEEWKYDATSVLQDAVCLFVTENIEDGVNDDLISTIDRLISKMVSVMKAGSSLWFDFCEILELQDACSALNWCNKALSFCSLAPYEDVKSLIRTAESVSRTYVSSNLWNSLMDGVQWLKRGMEVTSCPCNFERSTLSDAEEVLADYLTIKVKFSGVIHRLENSINNHKVWEEEAYHFLNMKSMERSWSQMLKLKDLGNTVAFKCSELDAILSEVEKVEKWKQHCIEIVGGFVRDEIPLLAALKEIKQTIDRSLCIYDNSLVCKERSCGLCSIALENQELLTCPICKEGYHFQSDGSLGVNKNHTSVFMCARCRCLMDTTSHHIRSTLRGGRNRPELEKLIQLKFKSEDFCVGIPEVNMLNLLVDQALVWRSRIKVVLDFASCHIDKDLKVVFEKLTIASKGLEVASIIDHEAISGLELAFVRNSWRVRVRRMVEDLQRPTLQQIELLLKKGLDLKVPPEDYYLQKLVEVKNVCVHWVKRAKEVAADLGALELDKVFELITEGENLPVLVEKELKLLRTRSMLYCICRKPYDQRAMIACDRCDEWYHFDCIKLHSTPKIFICPACKPLADVKLCTLPLSMDHESAMSPKSVEPKTPSPRNSKPRPKSKKAESGNVVAITDCTDMLRYSSGIERLWWRNRKPLRRAAKKRAELRSLSPLVHIQDRPQ